MSAAVTRVKVVALAAAVLVARRSGVAGMPVLLELVVPEEEVAVLERVGARPELAALVAVLVRLTSAAAGLEARVLVAEAVDPYER